MRTFRVRKVDSGGYQVRGTDPNTGRDVHQNFPRKALADDYAARANAAVRESSYVDPKTEKTTVAEWCKTWRAAYATRRPSTVREADTHLVRIVQHFGPMRLGAVKPTHVKSWTASLQGEGLAPSYVYALYARLAQVFNDAVHDGIVPRSPCSRRTSPPTAPTRLYVMTTEQVWALHDAMPEHLRPAVLLGAFAGLRIAEVCGLRVSDVDYMRGVVKPAVQYRAEPLKTALSRTPIPIPRDLANTLSAHLTTRRGEHLLADQWGHQCAPHTIQRAWRKARVAVPGLPTELRFHDLRHYYASLLIASGLSVKEVQTRMRHASAKVTLDTYGHLFPGTDDGTRAVVGAAFRRQWDSDGTSILDRG